MHQFIHIESYSRSAPKAAEHKNSGKGGRSVKYIIDEALRVPEACTHVTNPEPPIHIHGIQLEKIEGLCNAWADSVTDSRGHKLRKDGLCLLAGVISAPNDISDDCWEAFKKDSVAWLKDKYGDCLKSVMEHIDESHPHLHFYVIPKPGDTFATIHQGREASAEAKKEGLKKGDQNRAYKTAMREFQDDFYQKVGIKHGFTRIGPGKRRLTREEWKLEQVQAAAAARAIQLAEEREKTSNEEAVQVLERAKTGAEGVTKDAIKAAEVLAAKAERERNAVATRAKAEAQELAQKTLARANIIEREAEKKGRAAGISKGFDQVEKMPWFSRMKAIFFRAISQRDKLKRKLDVLQAERVRLETQKEGWATRAKRYFKENKVISSELKEKELELFYARTEAQKVFQLEREKERLSSALSWANQRIIMHEKADEDRNTKEHTPQQKNQKSKKFDNENTYG